MRWRFAVCLLLFGIGGASASPTLRFEVELVDASSRPRLIVEACALNDADALRWQALSGRRADVLSVHRSGGKLAEWRGERLYTPDWVAGDCLEWTIDAAAIAERDRWRISYRPDRYLRLPLMAWFWRPWSIDERSTLAFKPPVGWSVSAPWPRDAEGGRRLGATGADWPAQVAWFAGSERRIRVKDGELRVAILPTVDDFPADIEAWLQHTAKNLLTAAPRWPVGSTQVLVVPLPGVASAVPWGQVTRGGAAAVHLFFGAEVSRDERWSDWTATHEFAHLMHPFMGDRGRWLAEGLASYYQNVARSRSGDLSVRRAWEKLLAGLERGRAATAADQSTLLEVSRRRARGSTMRVYWSGAAFWAETDLALREQGRDLDGLLAAFAARHLPSETMWRPEEFVEALAAPLPAPARHQLTRRFQRYQSSTTFPSLDEVFGTKVDKRRIPAPVAAILKPASTIAAREPTDTDPQSAAVVEGRPDES